MTHPEHTLSRRLFMGSAAVATAGTLLPATAANALTRSPGSSGSLTAQPRDCSARLLAGHRLGTTPPHPPIRSKVTDFGAVADGATDCVEAFNATLRAAGESATSSRTSASKGSPCLCSPVPSTTASRT